MTENDAPSGLTRLLERTGLACLPGKLLYSSLDTLRPGKLYLLGYNPGGDPIIENESILSHICRMPAYWNEYIDADWRPGGVLYPAGAAPRQRRVQWLLAQLGLHVRSVCASNLIFVRSKNSNRLGAPAVLAERCWPVHQFILECVRPRCILSIGDRLTWDFIRKHSKQIMAVESFPSGHGNWQCLSAEVELDGRQMVLISVPDLTRYAIDYHDDVARWIGGKLG